MTTLVPGGDFTCERAHSRDRSVQALPLQNRAFAFGDIAPAAVFGRVMPFKTRCQAMGCFRCNGFIQGLGAVRVHIVNDQHHAFSLRVIFIRQQAQWCSDVAPGPTLGDPSVPPPSERFTHQQTIGTPMPVVCVVLPSRLPLLDRQPPAGKVMQLCAGCIQASGNYLPILP